MSETPEKPSGPTKEQQEALDKIVDAFVDGTPEQSEAIVEEMSKRLRDRKKKQ